MGKIALLFSLVFSGYSFLNMNMFSTTAFLEDNTQHDATYSEVAIIEFPYDTSSISWLDDTKILLSGKPQRVLESNTPQNEHFFILDISEKALHEIDFSSINGFSAPFNINGTYSFGHEKIYFYSVSYDEKNKTNTLTTAVTTYKELNRFEVYHREIASGHYSQFQQSKFLFSPDGATTSDTMLLADMISNDVVPIKDIMSYQTSCSMISPDLMKVFLFLPSAQKTNMYSGDGEDKTYIGTPKMILNEDFVVAVFTTSGDLLYRMYLPTKEPLDSVPIYWSADGKYLLRVDDSYTEQVMQIFDSADGKLIREKTFSNMRWNPCYLSGNNTLFSIVGGGVSIYNFDTGSTLNVDIPSEFRCIGISPSGNNLAASYKNRISVYTVK